MTECKKNRRRISSLPKVAACPAFGVLRAASADTAGAAAHSGSAVGRLIELWHRSGEDNADFDSLVAQVRTEVPNRWPLARMDDVLRWALSYCGDPRNSGTVLVDSLEREVEYSLPAAGELYPYGSGTNPPKPLLLRGHLDQVRRESDGVLRVWDVKSGRPDGIDMLYDYALQLAAYAVAATESYGEPVLPGGIIRLRGYHKGRRSQWDGLDEAPAFFHAPWTLEQARGMLDTIAAHHALLARGVILRQPGSHCSYCPGESPALCGEKLAELAA